MTAAPIKFMFLTIITEIKMFYNALMVSTLRMFCFDSKIWYSLSKNHDAEKIKIIDWHTSQKNHEFATLPLATKK